MTDAFNKYGRGTYVRIINARTGRRDMVSTLALDSRTGHLPPGQGRDLPVTPMYMRVIYQTVEVCTYASGTYAPVLGHPSAWPAATAVVAHRWRPRMMAHGQGMCSYT